MTEETKVTETAVEEAAAPAPEVAALEALGQELKSALGDVIKDFKAPRARRLFVMIDGKDLHQVVGYMVENWDLKYLSTIVGRDAVEYREVNYPFWVKDAEVTIQAKVPNDNAVIPTITDLIPGAVLYEREVYDIIGVFPEGHPSPVHQVLPDDWPEGEYPLLKSWPPKKEGGNEDGGD